MLILGIESSCDESAAALVRNGRDVLSNAVYSQTQEHLAFRGVVPEIAARSHLMHFLPLLEQALVCPVSDIDGIAVTQGPGLLGSLMVGVATAKALSVAWRKPLLGVNHIEGHLYSPHLEGEITFPYVALVCSGGHTALYAVRSFVDMILLGSTMDDAVGEAFDKVAKLLGLPYPGGPEIDRIAQEGDAWSVPMPVPLSARASDRHQFSYSGMKTAVVYQLREKPAISHQECANVAASFQRAAVDHLFQKTRNALMDTGFRTLTVSGGVSANSHLRKRFTELQEAGVQVHLTPLQYTGDNAAMIAGRAFQDFRLGKRVDSSLQSYSRLSNIHKGKRSVDQSPKEAS